MPYFLKTAEIKGASKYPAFHQEIELLYFRKVSESEVEIALSSGEFVASLVLYAFVGNPNLQISKAVLTATADVSLLSVVSTLEITNVAFTKTQLSANGITFFTLSGNPVKSNHLRDAASGLATGKRMHKPFAFNFEMGNPPPLGEIDVNKADKQKIRGFYKK